jgi:hypothetical protein
MLKRRYALRDRLKLIAFQEFLAARFPLTSYDCADIGDYVKLRFVRPLQKKIRLWKSSKTLH